MKFDIVIGNPPYQNSSSKTENNKLWIQFLEKGFDWGIKYLCFVTPDAWVTPISGKGKYKKLFREKQVISCNIYECGKHFPKVGSSFTYYLIENIPYSKPTKLTHKEGVLEVDLRDWLWIPKSLTPQDIQNLNETLWSNLPKIDFIGSQLPKKYNSKGQTEVFKYPFLLSTSTISYREEKCKYHDAPKIMFPYLATHTLPILDLGTMGATHGINIIFNNIEDAKEAFEYYKQDKIQNALKISKWHHGNANPQVLKQIPKYLK